MKYILLSISIVFFIGCGDATEEAQVPSSSITMQPNISYQVKKGDELKKTSSDAQVSITTSIQGSVTTVVLLEGSAEIVRSH